MAVTVANLFQGDLANELACAWLLLFPRAYSTSKFLAPEHLLKRRSRQRVSIFAVIYPSFGVSVNRDPPGGSCRFRRWKRTRFARLRHGINLSHWFAQSSTYSKEHLDTHTTAEDIALIKTMGFDHVRFTVEPAPLINPNDPASLRSEYLRYFDAALDMILAQRLAVIVDIHPSDEFKLRLKDDRQVENFVKFWRALAAHLSQRDPEMVFLETINEPMVEDPYRWYGIQAKFVAAIRAGAPKRTIIAWVIVGPVWRRCWRSSPTAIRMSFTIFTITIPFPLRIRARTGPVQICSSIATCRIHQVLSWLPKSWIRSRMSRHD
jgi:hypothetical protein